ncbi:MAG: hypothetical protein EXR73_05955 [Myxococcales bacterium]|nr:hypothetical protein [Myxococcales bacterium]
MHGLAVEAAGGEPRVVARVRDGGLRAAHAEREGEARRRAIAALELDAGRGAELAAKLRQHDAGVKTDVRDAERRGFGAGATANHREENWSQQREPQIVTH